MGDRETDGEVRAILDYLRGRRRRVDAGPGRMLFDRVRKLFDFPGSIDGEKRDHLWRFLVRDDDPPERIVSVDEVSDD